jgi:hypothetical protein
MTGAMIEILVVARSIGAPSRGEPLQAEGHAGLVCVEGSAISLAQAGPVGGLLAGAVSPCPRGDWEAAFAEGRGALWDSGETLRLPVSVLARLAAPADAVRLAAAVDALNARRLTYRYDPGPNSNTFVRWLLDALGHPLAEAPPGMVLRGWEWEPLSS